MSYNTGARIVRDGLVMYLDAANSKSIVSGSNSWRNLSGNPYTASLVNGPSYSSTNGGNISLDASNDYVDTGKTASDLGIYDASYTLFSFFYLKGNVGDNMIFGTTTTQFRQGMHLGARGSQWWFGHYSSDTQSAGGFVSANTWYGGHWTFNASTGNARIYINGNNIVANGTISSFIGGANILLGRFVNNYANVNIATALAYNRVLSPDEILQNYNATKKRFGL